METGFEEVVAAYRAGDYQRARELCEARLASAPDDPDASMWLGLTAMKERRWSDAIVAFDRALSIRVDPWSLANLGQCYVKTGELADAEYCLTMAKDLKPDLIEARVGLAGVLHGLRRFDDAIEELDDAARRAPDNAQVEARRGCTLVELGRYEEAQAAFARAAERGAQYASLVSFDRATWDALSSEPAERGTWHVALPPPEGAPRGVVLVSLDTLYARKYGPASLRALAEHVMPDLTVHVHVYDPDARVVGELAAIARDAGLARFTVTTEQSPFGADAPLKRKSYYACGRLLHLPEWLEHYRAPILTLDADTIAEAPVASFFDVAEPVDLRLNARHWIDAPWLDIVANVIVAFPTAAAGEYLDAVGRYARRYLESEADPWLLDQSALFCVYRMACRFGRPPRVDWMDHSAQPGLWHIGQAYDHLLGDPRFRRYADRRQPEG